MHFEHCAHELFEQQAERTPDSLAARYDGQALSYRALNQRANQLAHHLRQRGIGPEVLVGVLMPPSLEILIAVIGILKAGGAYVALDPHYPEVRLHEMIQACRLSCLLTTENLRGRVPAPGLESLCVDQSAVEIAAESFANLRSGVTLDHTAFVRFTSGSTGKPKGVVNIHRSIISRLASSPLPDIQASDICAINTAFGFGSRLFFPLAMGASLVVLREDEIKDVSRLVESLERNQATSILLVPSHLRELLDLGPNSTNRLKMLRAVTVGGEPVTDSLVARFRETLPQAKLISLYGGNEMGGAVAQRIMTEGPIGGRSIGQPVAGTRIYLLDSDMNPVPAGETGEIYVGSAHLARAYLDTAMQFAPDPWSGVPGGRMYRTGDLGRLSPNGEIEFLGRADRQVKVRGYRVELEEIEATLLDHPLIHQAAVAAHSVDGNHRLAAYVVGKAGVRPSVSQLRSYVRERMPEYMVPAVFVVLDQMPRTRNGKVDLQTLPPPGPSRPEVDNEYEAPRNSVEAAIAEIWSSLLGVEKVGIHDNFLELGGDSLLAARAISRIRNRLGAEVDLEAMLDSTIRKIAALLP